MVRAAQQMAGTAVEPMPLKKRQMKSEGCTAKKHVCRGYIIE